MPTIDVTLPPHGYQIRVEAGLLERLGEMVAAVSPHERAFLVVDSSIADTHGRTAREALERCGIGVLVHELTAAEGAKTLETVRGLYDVMLAGRLERRSPVVALGGGVVGDVAGFAAATYLRGVPVVQVPTTLLAMVDAAIGGKTGVNLPLPATGAGASGGSRRGELGKNLVGAFWQPRAIIVDPLVLRTLDPRDFRCGLAESVKHAVLGDLGLLEFIEANAEAILALEDDVLIDLIVRSAKVKVGIVEEDEREAASRMLLNLGHTFGHAIEPLAELDLRHGEAVSIGLSAALYCAVATGRLDVGDARRVTDLLRRLGLPTSMAPAVPAGRLVETMGFDKKVAGGRLRIVLPTELGQAEVAEDVTGGAILSAWRAVGAEVADADGAVG